MKNWSILVVDDSPVVWAWARRSLASRGHQVQTAGTMADVRECLATQAPDAVLLDLEMPGDIAAAAAWLIRNRCGRATPIIIHSALRSPTVVAKAAELAAAGIVPKGAAAARIEQIIDRSLSMRSVLGPNESVGRVVH